MAGRGAIQDGGRGGSALGVLEGEPSCLCSDERKRLIRGAVAEATAVRFKFDPNREEPTCCQIAKFQNRIHPIQDPELTLSARPCRYWQFLFLLTVLLLVLHALFSPHTPTSPYVLLIGYLGLAIEAILPLPQILANHRAKSCKGFRVSVLANWLLGDAMKMGFFFLSEEGKVPWAFKMCGIFQACCDTGLGVQWWVFGDGGEVGVRDKD